jgi:bifunctional polynucleotide phosphatase/kinase
LLGFSPLINSLDFYIESAVANFFTRASQKAKDRTTWSERSPDHDTPPTLLVAKYVPEDGESATLDATVKRHKIAAFDLVRATAGA